MGMHTDDRPVQQRLSPLFKKASLISLAECIPGAAHQKDERTFSSISFLICSLDCDKIDDAFAIYR